MLQSPSPSVISRSTEEFESVHVPNSEDSFSTSKYRKSDIEIQRKFNIHPRLEQPLPSEYICIRWLQSAGRCHAQLCRPRSLKGFRLLLALALLVHAAGAAAEACYLPQQQLQQQLPSHMQQQEQIIAILVLSAASVNCLLIVKLLCIPTTRTTLISFTLSVLLFCLYSVQTIIWYINEPSSLFSWQIAPSIALLVLVFFTIFILYR